MDFFYQSGVISHQPPTPRRAPTPLTPLTVPGSANYRHEHQSTASGDLCGHNVLCGLEAGERIVAATGNLCDRNLLFGLKPGVHQNNDLWLLQATFVNTACHADLSQGCIKIAICGSSWRLL